MRFGPNGPGFRLTAPSFARAAEDAHGGPGHSLPGLFRLGTVATAARDRVAAASPHEE